MEKWNSIQFKEFLEEESFIFYWFWFKGKITRKRKEKSGGFVVYECNLPYGEWNGQRFKNGFYNCIDILIMRGLKEGKYNGQTKSEFDKNYKRVSDIWTKSNGNIDRAIVLAKTQADRITDEWKAINRAMAAKESGYEEIFEVFFQRAYELGSVSKQEYREYKLEKLGL